MVSKTRLKLIASIFVYVVLTSLVLNLTWACGGGGGGGGGGGKKTDEIKKKKLTFAEKLAVSGWGGFRVPPEELKKWVTWLDKFKSSQKLLSDNGTAHEGFPPLEVPPWGYKLKNIGLPALCYLTPDEGYCREWDVKRPSTRWAFNAYMEKCEAFRYSGCAGNSNNFIKKLNCMKVCTNPEMMGCNTETDVPVDRQIYVEEKVPPEFLNRLRRCGNEPNV